jgi:hypothetical protein
MPFIATAKYEDEEERAAAVIIVIIVLLTDRVYQRSTISDGPFAVSPCDGRFGCSNARVPVPGYCQECKHFPKRVLGDCHLPLSPPAE